MNDGHQNSTPQGPYHRPDPVSSHQFMNGIQIFAFEKAGMLGHLKQKGTQPDDP